MFLFDNPLLVFVSEDLSFYVIVSFFSPLMLTKVIFCFAEVFEFDAMDDPPSVLNVEVFDFDGPFDENSSVGQAKINFLKTNISDLADIWVPLEGKFALATQSKLHLRIFLDNTRGGSVIKQYISKMEKEVGKKVCKYVQLSTCQPFVYLYQFTILILAYLSHL